MELIRSRQHLDSDVRNIVQMKIVHGFWKKTDERRIALLVSERLVIITHQEFVVVSFICAIVRAEFIFRKHRSGFPMSNY